MKTKVKILNDVRDFQAKKGDIGYIDGYVRGGDDIPYAVVVVKDFISFVPTYSLQVINIDDGQDLMEELDKWFVEQP